jgi:hypothetical protein
VDAGQRHAAILVAYHTDERRRRRMRRLVELLRAHGAPRDRDADGQADDE